MSEPTALLRVSGLQAGYGDVQVLWGVDLTVRAGEIACVVGSNGAGKTTLLRTLAGVYPPKRGTYRREGTIASFIDPMLGIEMDATGLENIRLRGLVMGLDHAAISRLAPGIAEFSGLGDYLAMPVRTYSAGMLMRLAFSIVTSVRADILLLDEWLSVGDAEFRERADERMREVVASTGILVLATHSQDMVRQECNRLIQLAHGQKVSDEPLGVAPVAGQ